MNERLTVRMRRQGWKAVVLLLMAVTLAACGAGGSGSDAGATGRETAGVHAGQEQDSGSNGESGRVSDTTDDRSDDRNAGHGTVYPLTVVDATGTEVTLAAPPQRIVSTSPSETEILFALGLGDRIVAVSDYDNYPAEALDKPKIGGTWDPNEEAILAMEPDLVIGGISMKPEIAERLRSLGLVLYKANPGTLEEALDTILQIGMLTGMRDAAEELVAAMREDLRRVTEAAATVPEEKKVKVYLEFAPGWTVGKGEYLDEMIRLAGGVNIAGDTEGWTMINEEHVIAQNPDVILYAADLIDMETGKPFDELIRSRPGWDSIAAIRENRLYGLSEDIISRTGPRITDALLQVAEALYPGMIEP
jgi:iron complex transport system substrate-binding protein